MQFLVNAEGGLTTAGYAVSIVAAVILFLAAVFHRRKGIRQKTDGSQTAGFLCHGHCAGLCHFLSEGIPHAFRRIHYPVQYAVHRTAGLLVRT